MEYIWNAFLNCWEEAHDIPLVYALKAFYWFQKEGTNHEKIQSIINEGKEIVNVRKLRIDNN